METFHRWISIHDVSSSKEHILKRLPDKKPFYSADDESLDWLENELCPWLEEWKNAVDEELKKVLKTNKNMTPEEKYKHRGLTDEPHEALLFTTRSTVSCIRFLLRIS